MERKREYDIIVVGGGAAGLAAAIGAKKAGASCLLIERNGSFGGEATNSNVASYCGFFTRGQKEPQQIVRGIGDEVLQELKEMGFYDGYKLSPVRNAIVTLDIEATKVAFDRLVDKYELDYAYLLIIAAVAAVVILPNKLSMKISQKAVMWIVFAAVLVVSVVFCRSDMQVSFVANVYRSTQRFQHYTYNFFTGDITGRNTEGNVTESYETSSWTPPAGYTQNEIKLENARGYYLSKEGGNHNQVVYYIHGGAYMYKYSAWYNDVVMRYSKAADDADVFALDYRTAPEDVYPCALEDAVDGYDYLLEQGYAPEDIIVAGDSAGGGLSTALTMYLRDHGYAPFSKLILSSPWADVSQKGASYTENRTIDVMFGAHDANRVPEPALMPYYAGENDVTTPYISPVYGTFENFPPTLIISGSDEMLLSDSYTVYGKIIESGGEAELIAKHGMWHCYFAVFPWCAESQEAWQTVADYIHK